MIFTCELGSIPTITSRIYSILYDSNSISLNFYEEKISTMRVYVAPHVLEDPATRSSDVGMAAALKWLSKMAKGTLELRKIKLKLVFVWHSKQQSRTILILFYLQYLKLCYLHSITSSFRCSSLFAAFILTASWSLQFRNFLQIEKGTH